MVRLNMISVRHHVHEHMTVKEPVTRALGDPGHRENASGRHPLRNGAAPACFTRCFAHAIPGRLHIKVEAVEVHCVRDEAEIYYPPPNGIPDGMTQSLAQWPRSAIHDCDLRA